MTDSLLRGVLFIVLFSLAIAGCGSSDDSSTASGTDDDAIDDDATDDDADDDADDDSSDDDTWPPLPDDDADDDTAAPEDPPRLRAVTGPRAYIADDLGREVLLRGVNFNHLGDYFETDPTLPTVAELSEEDWDDAAALGHNVVRLVTTWSAWEPERDEIDADYLDQVRDAVDEAGQRGMYVVIDMHQDAWSKFVFTPADEVCPPGTSHQRGWDGAPEWATITDGEPTCTPGRREESPAVIRAWDHFYDNTDGIRDELVELWGMIAAEFAADSRVAGYDLINEPGRGSDVIATYQGLSEFYFDAEAAIRAAEQAAGGRGHILFFEPVVDGIPSAFIPRIDNAAWAVHQYMEIFNPLSLEFGFFLFDLVGKLYGAPLWYGEYNHFGGEAQADAWMRRFAALEDSYRHSGGAWWQWEQECGDPHNVMWPPTPEWIEQQQQSCGNARFPVRECLDRAYPRAAPGRLTHLAAAPCDGDLVVEGQADAPGVADLWFPSDSDTPPTVTGAGIGVVTPRRVDGGWRIDVEVSGEYEIEVSP